MTPNTALKLLIWSPRILGILVAVFIGAFALDAVDEGIVAFLIHLAPSILLLLVVAVAWRWEWIGAAAFIGLALLYGANAPRWDWILVISGPLAAVGLLYLLSWRFGSAGRLIAQKNSFHMPSAAVNRSGSR
jgi:hypothetical protein